VGASLDQPYSDFHANVTTTLSLLEFARLYAPAARIVYLSSAAVYGNVDHLPIAESVPLQPVSPYGLHKKMAEDICRSYSRYFGIATAIVRLFSVYGPGLKKQLLWDTCTKMARQEITFSGGGHETRDWLHVRDAAALLVKARDHASTDSPTVNGGTGVGVTVREIVSEICNIWQINRAPVFSTLARPGDPVHYVADSILAQKWGWQPRVDWRDGLREYVEWFRKGAA
jgi:UDP-glucose 4-epimerase